jgi:phage-related protein
MGLDDKKPPRGTGRAATPPDNAPLPSRPIVWICSSKKDISGLPGPVKASFGYRLRQVQQGRKTADTKALTQFGVGVLELREAFDGNAFRVVHVVNLKKAVYVLHAFMKKSKSGIGLPKEDVDLIEARLKRARVLDVEERS